MADAETMTEQAASGFPPIADYGFLSDCETNCLVAPTGPWSGCACLVPIRRACSARSWTAPPGCSGSAH